MHRRKTTADDHDHHHHAHHLDHDQHTTLLDVGTTLGDKRTTGDSDSVKATDSETLEWTTGEKTLLIVFADHASLPGTPITSEEAVELTAKVSDFLASNNDGKITLSVTVGNTVYRPATALGLSDDVKDGTAANAFLGEVKALAKADSSVAGADYDPDQYVFTAGCSTCGKLSNDNSSYICSR